MIIRDLYMSPFRIWPCSLRCRHPLSLSEWWWTPTALTTKSANKFTSANFCYPSLSIKSANIITNILISRGCFPGFSSFRTQKFQKKNLILFLAPFWIIFPYNFGPMTMRKECRHLLTKMGITYWFKPQWESILSYNN